MIAFQGRSKSVIRKAGALVQKVDLVQPRVNSVVLGKILQGYRSYDPVEVVRRN